MRYGLIGESLCHSLSPQIHQYLFGYEYVLTELSADTLPAFLEQRKFEAVNVTIPYKEAIIPFLDSLDGLATAIGSVNTVINDHGKLRGYNTDFDGMRALLLHSGISLANKRVLVLGSGGTAKTAVAVAKDAGCLSVHKVSRTGREDCITYEDARLRHAHAQILINATPCGMYPNSSDSPIALDDFPQLEGVVDVIYNPLRTGLIRAAMDRGLSVAGGLYMLVAQAAKAGELFSGTSVAQEQIETVYRRIYKDQQNIVLVGMPGCGKTTVGQQLAQLMGRECVDTDAVISAKYGESVADILTAIGEGRFRVIERQVVHAVSSRTGVIISTGGGAILHRENRDALRQNGRIYYLDRPLEALPVGQGRPLSSTAEQMKEIYARRHPLYTSVADVCIAATGSVNKVADIVRKDFVNEDIRD